MEARHFFKEQSGAAMVELTIVAALLLTLVLGFVDFGYAFYQWNAATKAVQVGARLAAVSTPIATNLVIETATPPSAADVGASVAADEYSYVCTADAAGVASCSCVATTTDACDDSTSQSAFDRIFYGDRVDLDCSVQSPSRPGMCDFFPGLEPDEVQIEYIATGLGYWTRPGGPVPTIRVSIENHPFQFFFLSGLLGFANITMPNMLSTITGEDLSTTF